MLKRLSRLALLLLALAPAGLSIPAPAQAPAQGASTQGASTQGASTQDASTQGASTEGASTHTGAPALPPFLRQDLYPKWINAQAQVSWPPNDGFTAAPEQRTLPTGTLIDRFGSENGRFFSPRGESYASRAVPYVCKQMAYTVYRLLKPLTVLAGRAAPWFGEPGGATQFQTDEPAYKLRESGMIEVLTSDPAGSGKPAPQCAGS